MKTHQETIPRRTLRFPVDTVLFFLLFYLYVWLVIDPRLIHHSIGIFTRYFHFSFSTGWPFLQEHLALPGGLVEYGTRFLSQLYCFGWVGALIVTAAAWCTCLCTDVLTRLAGRSRGMVVRYGPPAILLMMYSTYSHPLSTILALLAAVSCFVLYLRLAPGGTAKRLPVLLVTCAALYHVAGAGSLLFPALVAVHEFLIRGRLLVAAAALLCGLSVLWLAGKMPFDLPGGVSYGQPLLMDPGVAPGERPYVLVLYLFFPAVLFQAVLARRASHAPAGPLPGNGASRIGNVFRLLWRGKSKWAIQMAIVLLATGAVAWFSLSADKRIVLEIDYYSSDGKWAQALAAAGRMRRGEDNPRCNRNIILALYHTGWLGDEMFCYPQKPRMNPFNDPPPPEAWDYGAQFRTSRMFLDLGLVNYAEKWAYEALETTGDLPAGLELLAVINIVKGRPETARLFLNALSKNPLHRMAAREMLRRLEKDPRLETDERVRHIRSVMLEKDSVTCTPEIEDILLALLEKNRHNKMAFEYLMAHYLRIRHPDKVVANIRRLGDFAYPRMPRHYQEAVLIYVAVTGNRFEIPGYVPDPEIVRRFREFAEIRRNSVSREDAAHKAMAAGFGNTYFFYFFYGAWDHLDVAGLDDSAFGVSGM